MSSLPRKVVDLARNWWAWIADYAYVGYWQIHGVLFRKDFDAYAIANKKAPLNKIPIVLIPGIYENWQFMKPIADFLHAQGHPIHIVDSLGYNTGEVVRMANIVHDFTEAKNISSYLLVAHSKGGLIGKYLLANTNTSGKIIGMIALNTPFSGSSYAYILPFKSTRVFIPNSPVLAQLKANTIVNERIVSIYGQFDPHVPKGSYLEGARNIQLNTRGHFRIMNNELVHAALLEAVRFLSPR
jgi:triacylglycerol lipase